MPAISSTFPAPISVAGSGRERLCMTSAAMRAPAPATSSRNSAKDSSASRIEASPEASGAEVWSNCSSSKTCCALMWTGRVGVESEPAAARLADDTAARLEGVTPAGPARKTPTRTAVSSPWAEPRLRGCSETVRDWRLRAIVAPQPPEWQTERLQGPVQSPSLQPSGDARCASRPGCLPRWKWHA